MAYFKMYGGTISTAPFITIYSAANDTVYYMKNGVAVTVCTTQLDGSGVVAKSALPNGTYTLYSTVAKDLPNDDTTNPYHKTVIVTGNTSEIYLMPDGAVYWYGYDPYIMYATSARPQSYGGYAALPTLTKNTNSFQIILSGYQNQGSVLTTDQIDATPYDTYKILVASVTTASGDYHAIRGQVTNSPTIVSNEKYNNTAYGNNVNTVISAPFIYSMNISSIDEDVRVGLCGTSKMTVNVSALWLE